FATRFFRAFNELRNYFLPHHIMGETLPLIGQRRVFRERLAALQALMMVPRSRTDLICSTLHMLALSAVFSVLTLAFTGHPLPRSLEQLCCHYYFSFLLLFKKALFIQTIPLTTSSLLK